jgi:hypothetical protein
MTGPRVRPPPASPPPRDIASHGALPRLHDQRLLSDYGCASVWRAHPGPRAGLSPPPEDAATFVSFA